MLFMSFDAAFYAYSEYVHISNRLMLNKLKEIGIIT